MEVPPLLPTCDPVSGLVGYEVQAVEGAPYGFKLGSHWNQAAVDVGGEDAVLLYSRDPLAPYGPGDMLRVSCNRLWVFGPVCGTPSANTATFTFACNTGIPAGLEIKPCREEITVFDALRLLKRSDADRFWLHFGQGDTTRDWRIGCVDGALCFYCASGKPSTPDKPGKLMAKLDAHGHLWLHGIVKEKTLP